MAEFDKITEAVSHYDQLEEKSVKDLLCNINAEDKGVAVAVEQVIPQIEALTKEVIAKLKQGGRLFYIGAGTSGRLGILDASECPPTFGVDSKLVTGLIAGGDSAIREAVEYAEDDESQAWKELNMHEISQKDFVIGIAASGTTSYVIGGLKNCKDHGIQTGGITSNPGSPLAQTADFPIEVVVGPEFVTGSSRMKSGSAQKMILNMISTTTMIQLGKIKGNKMIDMQLSNTKLVERGVKLIQEATGLPAKEAHYNLKKYGSVRAALQNIKMN